MSAFITTGAYVAMAPMPKDGQGSHIATDGMALFRAVSSIGSYGERLPSSILLLDFTT